MTDSDYTEYFLSVHKRAADVLPGDWVVHRWGFAQVREVRLCDSQEVPKVHMIFWGDGVPDMYALPDAHIECSTEVTRRG